MTRDRPWIGVNSSRISPVPPPRCRYSPRPRGAQRARRARRLQVRGHRHQPLAHQQPGRRGVRGRRRARVGLSRRSRTCWPRSRSSSRRRSRRASEDEILEDPAIQLVLSSGIPVERAPLGIRVMQHGKDYMADKPGITTLEQLAEVRKVQAETKRIYSIMYSERFENRATVKAGELVKAGAIGQVIQTDRPRAAPDHAGDAAGVVLGQGRSSAASSATSRRTRPTSSSTSPARRRRRSSSSQVGNVHHPDKPGLRGFRRRHAARQPRRRATSAWTGSRPTACRRGATAA